MIIAISTESLALTVSVLSLLTSIVVGVAQIQLWKKSGPVLKCQAELDRDRLIITALNRGRAAAAVAGFGVTLPDGVEYPWVTATAERYWPGAGKAPSLPAKAFPHTLPAHASASWYIPLEELRSALVAFERKGQSVRPYVETGSGRVVLARAVAWKRLEPPSS